jgi:hypothetical protein
MNRLEQFGKVVVAPLQGRHALRWVLAPDG